MGVMPKFPVVVSYPAFLNTCGNMVGDLRQMTNRERDEKHPEYTRGDRSGEVHPLGARAELIARFTLFSQGIPYEATPLLAPHPQGEPDIIIRDKIGSPNGEMRIDVKGSPEGASDLLMNQRAHNKASKGITHYWFIQQLSDELARFWIFKYAAISNWKVKKLKYGPAHAMPICDVISEAHKLQQDILRIPGNG